MHFFLALKRLGGAFLKSMFICRLYPEFFNLIFLQLSLFGREKLASVQGLKINIVNHETHPLY